MKYQVNRISGERPFYVYTIPTSAIYQGVEYPVYIRDNMIALQGTDLLFQPPIENGLLDENSIEGLTLKFSPIEEIISKWEASMQEDVLSIEKVNNG
jgi:hypothetical protein